MALVTKSAGFEKNAETGESEYIVRLLVETPNDAPALTAGDIWNGTPMRLCRASRIEALEAALDGCRDYFDDRADAEYFTDSPGPVANAEMLLLVTIDEALK